MWIKTIFFFSVHYIKFIEKSPLIYVLGGPQSFTQDAYPSKVCAQLNVRRDWMFGDQAKTENQAVDSFHCKL